MEIDNFEDLKSNKENLIELLDLKNLDEVFHNHSLFQIG